MEHPSDMTNKLGHTSATTREFTIDLLRRITDNFSKDHVIGRGAFGVVYRGVLDDGKEIALKRLHYVPGLDDTQFRNELHNLKRAQHTNITQLVGYCYDEGHQWIKYNGEYVFATIEERVLCFEYLQGGSLDKHISDESCGLDWHTRFKIIKGVSEGLHYLHNGCKHSIYHLDLKPENILLDKNMVPKIGDFGLSRLFFSTRTYVTSKIMGTPGYMPPEYIDRFEITSKFDVFSLGVIIIRVVAGYEGYSKCACMSSQEFLEHVHENWRKRLQQTMSLHISEQVRTCTEIALRCVEADRVKRPTITEIIDELNKIDDAESLSVGKLQAIQAKMGSAEDEFTLLSQLKYGMDKCKVRVRISRLWESFNPKNDTLFGLDCLLIDNQGQTMQARVLPGDIEWFEHRLVEGKVYALSDFHIDVQRDYYMSCRNEWTMYFGRQTVVTEIEGDIDSIPLHSFEFVKFKDLRSRCDDNSLLTDVLGHVVHVGELQEVTKRSRVIEICNASIRDLRGRVLGVTLYGDIASGFAEDVLEKGQGASVVAVFAGMSVDSSSSVCSTTSSEYYVDLEIPEVQEFRENLLIQQANPVPKKTAAQKLAESWRTIEQIKSLDPEEYDEDTMFLCRVSLVDIDCSKGWCYLGCDTCQKSMYGAPRKYKCGRCGSIKRPIQWYKLKAKVQDATGTMNLMIFCEVAEKLVGVSAEELVDEIEDDDEWYTLPEQIEDLLGSTHTFQVFDKYGNGSFSVNSIMDNVGVPPPAATTSQSKEKPVHEGSQRPNKRPRGDDDSIN